MDIPNNWQRPIGLELIDFEEIDQYAAAAISDVCGNGFADLINQAPGLNISQLQLGDVIQATENEENIIQATGAVKNVIQATETEQNVTETNRKRQRSVDIVGPIEENNEAAKPPKCIKVAIVTPLARRDDEDSESHVSLSDEEPENADDDNVELWSNTQVRAWDGVTFNTERDDDDEVETVRSQTSDASFINELDNDRRPVRNLTPYAFHDEAASNVDADEETVGDELRAASQRHEGLLHEIINRLNDIEQSTNTNQIVDVVNSLRHLQSTVYENFATVHDTLREMLRERRLLVELIANLNHFIMRR